MQDDYISSASKVWTQMSDPNLTANVNVQLIKESLVITAGLPQVLVTALLYLFLGIAALIVSRRTPGTPFTLAGILTLRSKLSKLQSSEDRTEGWDTQKMSEKADE